MAVDLKQYDDWVIKNQKDVLDWVKMYSTKRYDDVKKAFEKYHRAKSKWQQIDAFEKIKEELKTPSGVTFEQRLSEKFTPARERLQRTADKYTDGDIDALWNKFSSNQDMLDYERYKNLYKAISSIPAKADKYENVELDRAFRDNYDYKAMKALADKYNYDYTDPKDRKEFLKHLSDIETQRLKMEAYQPKDVAGMITQMAYPVSLEYARKNEDKIRTDGPSIGGVPLKGVADMALPLLTDAVSQGAMAVGAGVGNRVAGQAGEMIGGMGVAPAITEAGQYLVNDKPAKDALADYGVGVATNAIAPGSIYGMFKGYQSYIKPKVSQSVKSMANQYADMAEKNIRAARNGVPQLKIPDLTDDIITRAKPELDAAKQAFYQKHAGISKEKLDDLWLFGNEGKATRNTIMANAAEASKKDYLNTVARGVTDENAGVTYRNFLGKEKTMTPKQLNKAEEKIQYLTPEDQALENVLWRWNKKPKADYVPSETITNAANRMGAQHKILNEEISPYLISQMGVTESFPNAVGRWAGRYSEPLQSLGMNLGATTRLTDRKLGMMDRYLNLPWKYGESEKREIDFSNPSVKAYMKAYSRYKSSPDYFGEPPKLKGYSDEELAKIQKATEIIKLKDIFGE